MPKSRGARSDAEIAALPPQFVEELSAKIAALLVDRGCDVALAQGVARDCADYVRSPGGWGGQQIYIASKPADYISRRNRDIAAMFNGRNLLDVCREYGLSATQARRIVAAVQENSKNRGQLP